MKNEKTLAGKGVKAEALDYVMFKVSKLVDDKTTFEKMSCKKYRPPILTYQSISDKNIVSSLKNLKKLLKSKEFLPIKRKPI